MPAHNVSRITPQQFTAYEVVNANVGDIYALCIRGAEADKFDYEVTPHRMPDGSIGSRVILRYKDETPDKVAYPNYWMIVCDDLEIAIYDPPTAQAIYTENVAMAWTATTTAPAAALNDDGTATLTFRQPKSINGPFAYAVTRTDGETPADVPVLGDPVATPALAESNLVLGADVQLTIDGPAAGQEATYTVTATATKYGTKATSAPVTVARPSSDPGDEPPA